MRGGNQGKYDERRVGEGGEERRRWSGVEKGSDERRGEEKKVNIFTTRENAFRCFQQHIYSSLGSFFLTGQQKEKSHFSKHIILNLFIFLLGRISSLGCFKLMTHFVYIYQKKCEINSDNIFRSNNFPLMLLKESLSCLKILLWEYPIAETQWFF